MNDFNAQQFLDAQQTASVETRFTPVPVGDYPAAVVPGTLKIERVNFKDGNEGARFRIQWAIDGEVAGMKSPKVRQDFLLDIDGFDANGAPRLRQGPNQNVRLGRLIVLAGMKPTDWTYRGLDNARGVVKVGHRPDKDDPEIVYAEVTAVAAQ
jgi:hypothetical protein